MHNGGSFRLAGGRLDISGAGHATTEDLMLDIHARDPAGRAVPFPDVEFVRLELAPLKNGRVYASLTATTVDAEEPQLLDQQIACATLASLDDLLALIRTHVQIGGAQ